MTVKSSSTSSLRAGVVRRTLLAPAAAGPVTPTPTGGMILSYTFTSPGNFSSNSTALAGDARNAQPYITAWDDNNAQLHEISFAADGNSVRWHSLRSSLNNYSFYYKPSNAGQDVVLTANHNYRLMPYWRSTSNPTFGNWFGGVNDSDGSNVTQSGFFFGSSGDNTFARSIDRQASNSDVFYISGYAYASATLGTNRQPAFISSFNSGGSHNWSLWDTGTNTFSNDTIVAGQPGNGVVLVDERREPSDSMYRLRHCVFSAGSTLNSHVRWYVTAHNTDYLSSIQKVVSDGISTYVLYVIAGRTFLTKITGSTLDWTRQIGEENAFDGPMYMKYEFNSGNIVIANTRGRIVVISNAGNLILSRRMYSNLVLRGVACDNSWIYLFGTISPWKTVYVIKIPLNGSQSGFFTADGQPFLFEPDTITLTAAPTTTASSSPAWASPSRSTNDTFGSKTTITAQTLTRTGI